MTSVIANLAEGPPIENNLGPQNQNSTLARALLIQFLYVTDCNPVTYSN